MRCMAALIWENDEFPDNTFPATCLGVISLLIYENKASTVCSCYVSYLTVFFSQATAEQIRLAQVIYDKNDADFEDKVKQVMCLCICTCIEKLIFRMTSIPSWGLGL